MSLSATTVSFLLAAVCIAGTGCMADVGADGAAPTGTDSVQVLTEALYGQPSTYWTGSPPMIPVCWEPATFNDSFLTTRRTWIEDAIRGNWNRFARLNLVAAGGASTWQACSPGQAGIHAYIAPTATECGGFADAIGSDINGMDNALRLPRCVVGECGVGNELLCSQVTPLHEFGHTLGFYNEDLRPDEGPWGACPDNDPSDPEIPGGQKYGAFNCDSTDCSVMAPDLACNATATGGISAGDIAGIQRAYGRRIRGSMVTTRGRCVASVGNAVGDEAFILDCDEFQNDQEWDLKDPLVLVGSCHA